MANSRDDRKKNDIDLTDEEERLELEKMAKLKNIQAVHDWRYIMGMPEGRRMLREILSWTGYHNDPFDNHNARMAHNCGRLRIGRMIEQRLTIFTPEDYMTLMSDKDAVV